MVNGLIAVFDKIIQLQYTLFTTFHNKSSTFHNLFYETSEGPLTDGGLQTSPDYFRTARTTG